MQLLEMLKRLNLYISDQLIPTECIKTILEMYPAVLISHSRLSNGRKRKIVLPEFMAKKKPIPSQPIFDFARKGNLLTKTESIKLDELYDWAKKHNGFLTKSQFTLLRAIAYACRAKRKEMVERILDECRIKSGLKRFLSGYKYCRAVSALKIKKIFERLTHDVITVSVPHEEGMYGTNLAICDDSRWKRLLELEAQYARTGMATMGATNSPVFAR